jgi:esterase/lipase
MIDTVRYLSEQERQRDDIVVALENPLSSRGKFSVRYLVRVSPFIRTTLTNARFVRAPTLILQGDLDGVVAPEGAKRLLETISTSDKSLKTFSGATHGFYDSLPPRQNSKYDDATRKRSTTR